MIMMMSVNLRHVAGHEHGKGDEQQADDGDGPDRPSMPSIMLRALMAPMVAMRGERDADDAEGRDFGGEAVAQIVEGDAAPYTMARPTAAWMTRRILKLMLRMSSEKPVTP